MSRRLLLTLAAAMLIMVSRAHATVFQYQAFLDGPSESPAQPSPGIGYATANYDNVAHTLALNCSFSGLLGATTASHIHAATVTPFVSTAGVATTTPSFAGFPLGVTSGTFANTLDLTQASSYNPSYVSANGGTTATAEAALTSAIAQGRAYWNIHSQFAGGGEIRGFLIPLPEPGSISLLGLAGVGMLRRRRA